MSRYMDVDLVHEKYDEYANYSLGGRGNGKTLAQFLNWVDEQPTADVYEIVREYCEKRCLAVVDNVFLIHLVNKMVDEMKKKPIDPVAIKQAIKDGQLVCFEKNERIYIQDGITGDCVCVLNLAERKECNE